MDVNTFNVDDWLNDARLPEKTLLLCLRLDLVAEYEELKRKRPRDTDSLSDGDGDLAEQLDELRERMKAATVTVRMRALTRKRRRQLLDANPPTEGDELQVAAGYNPEGFFAAAVPESIVEPKLTGEQWERLQAKLTEDQWGELCDLFNALNHRKVDIPN